MPVESNPNIFYLSAKDRTRSSICHCLCECICIHGAPWRVFECIKNTEAGHWVCAPLLCTLATLLIWFVRPTADLHPPLTPPHVHARYGQSNHRWHQHRFSLVLPSLAPKSLGWIPRVCRFLLHREPFNDLIRISQHLVKLNLPKWLFFVSCMLSLLHRNSISWTRVYATLWHFLHFTQSDIKYKKIRG